MIQDFANGVQMTVAGLTLASTSAAGIMLSLAWILLLVAGVVVGMSVMLAWSGFELLCYLATCD